MDERKILLFKKGCYDVGTRFSFVVNNKIIETVISDVMIDYHIMEEEIMRKLRTYNVYSIKEYEDIRKAVRYSIRFCKKHKIVRCEDKNLNKERNEK